MRQIHEYSIPSRRNFLKLDKYSFSLSLFLFAIGIFLLPKTAYLSSITSERLVELTNIEREEAGSGWLKKNVYLEEAALRKAEAILQTQTFDHNIKGRKFSSWVKDVGYEYSYVGENLAIDFLSAEGVVNAWMESESHKKNLLNNEYKEIGIAVVEGDFSGSQTIIVAQIFATPLKINVPIEIAARNEYLNPMPFTAGMAKEEHQQISPWAIIIKSKNVFYVMLISLMAGAGALFFLSVLPKMRLHILPLLAKESHNKK